MEKYLIGISVALGILFLLTGIYTKVKNSATAVSIIGGADGPTSIFIAGKVGTDFSMFGIIIGIILAGTAVIIAVKSKK